MRCEKCGTENEKGTLYCIGCGNNLEEKTNSGKKEIKSFDKKMVIIVGVAVALILLVILLKIFKGTSNKSESDLLFDADGLIMIKEGEKYGYINTEGKVVIEPKYKQASEFYGDYAIVTEIVSSESGDTYVNEIIDKKGKVILTPQSLLNTEYMSEYNVWIIDNQLYNGSLKKISSDGVEVSYESEGYFRWKNETKHTGGIMNVSGKVTYTYDFKEDESYIGIDPSYIAENIAENLKDKYCRITIDNEKYAVVNCDTGKVVYDYTDKFIYSKDSNIFEISNYDPYEALSTLYIQGDKIIYQSENGDIELEDYYIDKGYITIYNEKEYKDEGYIDIKQGKVVSEKPDYRTDNVDINLDSWEKYTGLTKFSCNDGYGLMKNKEIIVNCEWEKIDYFDRLLYEYLESKGKPYVIGEKDDKIYLINIKNGKVVEEFNTSSITNSSVSTFIYYTYSDTSEKVIYNLITGKSISVPSNDKINVYSNYITVEEDNKLNYYNTNLKLIYTQDA